MTGSNPRPPRIRRSRGTPAGHKVQPGHCYLCGAPSSSECRQCHRPICDAHQVPLSDELKALFGPDACAECARFTVDDLARDTAQWARKRELDLPHRTCAICSQEFEQALPECSRCGRPLCPKHAVRYRKRFRFGARGGAEAAWYWDREVSCPEHRLNPVLAWLRGWEREPAALD